MCYEYHCPCGLCHVYVTSINRAVVILSIFVIVAVKVSVSASNLIYATYRGETIWITVILHIVFKCSYCTVLQYVTEYC